MKKSVLLIIIGLLTVILFSCSVLSVNALQSNEWSWTYTLSSTTYYQGDSGTITITFTSNCPDQLQLSSLSVQFDWMTTPITETVNSPYIATGNQYTFSAISFSIPSDATVKIKLGIIFSSKPPYVLLFGVFACIYKKNMAKSVIIRSNCLSSFIFSILHTSLRWK